MNKHNESDAKWYVVHTYSSYENNVATNIAKAVENRRLQDLIQEIKVPTEIVEEIKDGKVKQEERKLFPGYVFLKMVVTDDTWYVVQNIRGVTGFVGPGSNPVPLTKKEVDSLGVEEKRVEVHYQVGDAVEVIDGSMQGFSGTVSAIDTANNKVEVVVSLLGRETKVELELSQIALV